MTLQVLSQSLSIGMKNLIFFLIVLHILLIVSGTVEINPGPDRTKKSNFSFAVWNLDSIPARNFARIPLIETFQATYDFDLFGVCESLLDKNILNEDIFINGFSPDPFRADKLEQSRNGGVCLYFKKDLPIKERKDLQFIPETIVAEIKINRKKIFLVLSYCHPNLTSDEFDAYTNSLEHIYKCIRKENPAVTILTGDFNARSPLFCDHDIENKEGRTFNNFLLTNNLEELINEPTHIRDNGSQSCIDLLCTDQAYLFTKTGVYPSLDSHSKHNIIHGTLNFNIHCPPPYKRKIWDYSAAPNELIKEKLKNTNWFDLFYKLNVNEMSIIFSDVIMDIFCNHIPNKIITCNDRDAPWITLKLKTAIKRNSRVYRKWVKRGRNSADYNRVLEIQKYTNRLIKDAKHTYFEKLGEKLSDPRTGHKHFWTAFKRISNKKKTTNIPPIFDNNTFISNISQKANMFNDYFAEQCEILDNGSILPELKYNTNAFISDIEIPLNRIISIINKMDPNKGGGYDGISISMLQICASEVAVPLQMIFQKSITTGLFPDIWKYANVQPIHKKSNRQDKSNYRPISLLPICGKLLEKVVFDEVYSYLNSHNLLSKNQSGFRPGDSTIYQLISITSKIYESFENYDETRAVFLDISKAFDKVWHDGVVHKLKCNGISGNLLNFFENYLKNRHQRVILNGTESNWRKINSGVPQGSVLGPLLFLVYINDLTDDISSQMRLFADDSSMFTRVNGIDVTQEKLIEDLEAVSNWAYQWKMVFNPNLNKQAIEVVFSVKKDKGIHPDLSLNGIPVEKKDFMKHLGFYLDSRLCFSKHIKEAVLKAKKGLSLLKYLSKYVSRKVLDLSYKLYVRPHLDYGDVIYHNQRMDLMKLIEQVQYSAALIVSGCWKGSNRERLYEELGWESLSDRRWCRRLCMFYKIKKGFAPAYLSEHIPNYIEPNIELRNRNERTLFSRTDRYSNSFFPYCINNWNKLDATIKALPSLSLFKKHLNTYIRPTGKSCYGITDSIGIKLLTKIRVGFSDLRDHRYNHKFNCASPVCSCRLDDETSEHFFLCCPLYRIQRNDLLSKISDIIGSDISVLPNDHLYHLLIFGSNVYNSICNKQILEESISFIKKSGRFNKLEAF